jgi:S1-C subfamily serine protease
MQHEIDTQRKRVWEVPNNFVLALAQLPTDTMHLVYSATGSDMIKKLTDTSFSFFDGMFVGSPNNDVEVLGVEKGSYADQGGVKPGDTITAVGGTPVGSDLNAFASTFAAVKKSAHDNQQSSFPLTVRNSAGTRTVSIPLTPSIKSFLNGGL